jgi:hypothetical protein
MAAAAVVVAKDAARRAQFERIIIYLVRPFGARLSKAQAQRMT